MSSPSPDVAARPWWRWVVAGLGLLICTGGPSGFLCVHVFHVAASWFSWPYVYLFGATALAGTIALVLNVLSSPPGRPALLAAPIGAFVVWALLSALWTVSPQATAQAATLNVGIVAFAIWFGWTLTFEEHVHACLLATTLSLAASLPLIVFSPAIGRMPVLPAESAGGEWRGIFANRNSFGAVCLLGMIAAIGWFMIRPTTRRAIAAASVGMAQLVGLVFSRNDTSLLTLAICVGAGALTPLLWWLKRRGVQGWTVAAVAFALVIAAWKLTFDHLDRLAAAVGRDPTLSSRRLIWYFVRYTIDRRPVLGWGYWGFWDQPALTADTYYGIGKDYGSAHNGVLEVMLMLGAVGLVIYVLTAVVSIGGILRWAYKTAGRAQWWWMLIAAFVVGENLTESFVLWHSYIWVLFVAAAFVPMSWRRRAEAFGQAGSPTAPLQAEHSNDAGTMSASWETTRPHVQTQPLGRAGLPSTS